jgi:MYXO-CTERM domain-containing protein
MVGAAAMMLFSAASANAVATLTISDVALQPGQSGPITVTLATGGDDIAGTENRIGFPAELTVDGCVRNEAINKGATAFAGTNPITALVLALDNTAAIPDGSVLYTCTVTVSEEAADGELEVECSGPGASDPDGNSIDSECVNGIVTVTGPPQGSINIGSVTGAPGTTASVEVSLTVVEGAEIAGTENVITFGTAGVQLQACVVNPGINKGGTAFSFQPSGSVKALVLALDNTDAIPTDSVLYTCQVAIGADVENGTTIPLTCSEPGASDGEGNPVLVECSDGLVTVAEATPTPTSEPTSTNTPDSPTPTDTPDASPTPTNTSTNTPTRTPSRVDDDSCAIVAPESTSTGWMLLLPMAGLLWLRRRNG